MSASEQSAALASWRSWIGREDACTQLLDVMVLRRFAVAIGDSLDVEHHWPALGHWAYFQPALPMEELGPDGHPRRGGFFPPVTLPRRMFASAEIQFVKPLAVNAEATAVSSITDVRGRSGRTGDLVIVDVQRSIEQFGVSCIQERQSIVYREAGTPIAEIVEEPIGGQPPEPQWCPSPVDLFRFSAATSNSHRIHYDHIYATQVEGYPRLVVQGPLIAARLFAYASSHTQLPIRRYVFRSVAPCFVWQAIRFGHGESRAELRATRCDGVIAMEATAQ